MAGGVVGAFNPDEYLAGGPTGAMPTPAPSSTPVDPLQLHSFNPQAYLNEKDIEEYKTQQAQYGGAADQAAAALLGFARGQSLGTSDFLATRVLGMTPEYIRAVEEANPGWSMTGELAGSSALLIETGGLAAPIEAASLGRAAAQVGMEASKAAQLAGQSVKVASEIGKRAALNAAGTGRQTAARVLGYGVEGSTLAVGNIISDLALGDPTLNGQKILAELGMGAAMGGALGAASKLIEQTPALTRQARQLFGKAKTAEGLAAEAKPLAEIGEAAIKPAEETPVIAEPFPKARSFEEIQKQNEQMQKYGGFMEEGERLELKDIAEPAAERLRNEGVMGTIPINQMQIDSLASPDARNAFLREVQLPGKTWTEQRNQIQMQKRVLDTGLGKAIEDVAPGWKPATTPHKAGETAAKILTDEAIAAREELGQVIDRLKNTKVDQQDHVPGVVEYLINPQKSQYANPFLERVFKLEEGQLKIARKYSVDMGITKDAYKLIKEAIEGVKNRPNDFKNLFTVRDSITHNLPSDLTTKASDELIDAKAAIMDYVQDLIQKVEPDIQVREGFARAARNEETINFIEKNIGARIGRKVGDVVQDNWKTGTLDKPEEWVSNKIFQNSVLTSRVQEFLKKKPEEFQKILADYLSVNREAATDLGKFNSKTFHKNMIAHQSSLDLAFPGARRMKQYERINDIITTMRAFTDNMPANPSGTAPTLVHALMQGLQAPAELLKYGKFHLEDMRARSQVNDRLAGIAEQQSKLGTIERMIERSNEKIVTLAKAAVTPSSKNIVRAASVAAAVELSEQAYEKHVDTLKQFAANPQKISDHLAENTDALHSAAPNITQALHTTFIRAVQFLESKIPKATQNFPLSQPAKPTSSQMHQFNQYWNAVSDPTGALKQVKMGILTSETMEALQVVHPAMLQNMRAHVMQEINLEDADKMHYSQKIMLSKFLGMPLDSQLTPQALQANQIALNTQLSEQSTPKEGRKTGQGGMKQLNSAMRSATRTERMEES